MRKLAALRPWLIVITFALVIATIITVLGSALWNWKFGLHTRDKTVIVNTVVAFGAYILVALALLVALAAYIAATGRPKLSPVIQFTFSEPNEPVFWIASDSPAWGRTVKTYKQTEGNVSLKNDSPYAARNPGMRITLDGLGGIAPQQDWTIIQQANMVGITAIQWDGGADYIIHGRWSRTLPRLDVKGMFAYKEDPAFVVEIAADGFDPETTRIPVRILDEEDYARYSNARAEKYRAPDDNST
jgi:hypothetical protein